MKRVGGEKVRTEPRRAAGPIAGSDAPVYWVGLGASAGGLEAIIEIARRLSPCGRALYVIAQHTSPTHKSLLTELIQRQTELEVVELGEEPVAPRVDVIYVAPANADVIVESGSLRLTPASLAPGAPKPSINRLFLTLAHEIGERAIAVVLSGTGSDGAYGVQAVRAAGGITIAQDPKTAKYDGMPVAAAKTGCIDLVLTPEAIGARFAQIVASPRALSALGESEGGVRTVDDLLARLATAHGVNFREYKPAMVHRRIERRMAALGYTMLPGYVEFACQHPAEIEALYRDLMISVTSFFRDEEEFGSLRSHLERRSKAARHEPLRLWIAGCATGEEAYSILMLVADALGGPECLATRRVQAFATDIDEAALQTARRGVYPKEAFDKMEPVLRERFFDPHPEGFAVRKVLRDAVVFTRHNLAQDPPFRQIDIISCRNVLIYFGLELQARVLNTLRYAIKPEGVLFLGRAETTAANPDAFRPCQGNPRILTANALAPGALSVHDRRTEPERAESLRRDLAPSDLKSARTERNLFDAVARSLGGDCLLVSNDMRVRRCYGAVARYLEPIEGDFGLALNRLLHPRHRREAVSLAQLALRTAQIAAGPVHTPADDPATRERLKAYPLETGAGLDDRLVLLAFERWEEPPKRLETAGETDANRLAALEAELDAKGRSLSMTIEELETANEELQALNEEMQSTNEEVQSANEELQTANEELQSTNQELTTVNEELQIRSTELAETAANLGAILSHIATAILVVDTTLRVTAASDEARRLFRIPAELGEDAPRVESCHEPDGFPRLAEIFREALAQRRRVTQDVVGRDHAWGLTVAPYASRAGALAGAIAIVTDETERFDRSRRLEEAMDKLSASNAELERFSYVASHDLKEPVRTLAGYADFLNDPEMTLSDAERGQMLGSIRENARRLGEIIDSLLAFSRLDREIHIETVDLTAIAREAVEVLRRVIADAGATVDLRPLPSVRASRVHMRQLFQNLIGNAVKFRGEAPCRIVVGASAGEPTVISVEDNGPGVPAEARETVFEVFRRLRPRDEIDGAGLGLSICRKIVEQYRGRIWCEDSVLGGAAFRLTLPGA